MTTRLTLNLDHPDRPPRVLEADDDEGVLDQWNALPWYASYSGPEFAEALVRQFGLDDPKYIAEPIELPVEDSVLLDAVAEASGDGLKLERFDGRGVAGRIADALTGG